MSPEMRSECAAAPPMGVAEMEICVQRAHIKARGAQSLGDGRTGLARAFWIEVQQGSLPTEGLAKRSVPR